MAQTEEVLGPLREIAPDTEFTVVPMIPQGDRNKDAPLLSMDRGMFTKDLEVALLNGDVDLAVHSAKDLPPELPEGLVIGAFGRRKDARDALVDRWGARFYELPAGARIGTSSPRRIAQLKTLRPDIQLLPIRGNVGTRLEKAGGDEYDGVVVAAAGLERLQRRPEISEFLAVELCTPEVGQGALAIEARADDSDILEMLAQIEHLPTTIALKAERSFLTAIGGGCQVPLTAYATVDRDRIDILATASEPDGGRTIRVRVRGHVDDPESAGRLAVQDLLEAGASEIISESLE
jgi:hydroxymethylbilane synthase